jgi:hypothetical protein
LAFSRENFKLLNFQSEFAFFENLRIIQEINFDYKFKLFSTYSDRIFTESAQEFKYSKLCEVHQVRPKNTGSRLGWMDGFWRVESSQTPARGPQFGPNVQPWKGG